MNIFLVNWANEADTDLVRDGDMDSLEALAEPRAVAFSTFDAAEAHGKLCAELDVIELNAEDDDPDEDEKAEILDGHTWQVVADETLKGCRNVRWAFTTTNGGVVAMVNVREVVIGN